MGRFGKAKRQALHMVMMQYTAIEGHGAEWWIDEAHDWWHQPVICTVDDIKWAMNYMEEKYWTVME